MKDLTNAERILARLVEFKTTEESDTSSFHSAYSYIDSELFGLPLHKTLEYDGTYPIYIATTQPTKKPKVLFISHIDVVPGDDQQFLMTHDTLRLYGRGVWDMKYAIAGWIDLAQTLGTELKHYDFGIAITPDEETRNKTAKHLLNIGYRPECVIILDGSEDWQLESGSKGALGLNISASGKSAHGSRPWEGVSASMNLLDAISEIRTLFTTSGPESDTLNISGLKAGTIHNQLPDQASAYLDIRPRTNLTLSSIKHDIDQIAERYNLTVTEETHIPALEHNLTNPYLVAYERNLKQVTGRDIKALLSFGASDAAAFTQNGIPCIVTRPIGGGHHSDEEWLERQSFAEFIPIFSNYLSAVGTLDPTEISL